MGEDETWDPSGRFRVRSLRGASELRNGGRIPVRRIRNRKKVHPVPQIAYADCGPTALYMAMRTAGSRVDLESVRESVGAGRDGSSGATLIRVARRLGMRARGLRVGVAGIASLEPGSILFWRFNHFVVLESVGTRQATIVDPASGRRKVSIQELDRDFTGLAIEVTAGADRPKPERPAATSSPWRHLAIYAPPARAWIPAILLSALVLAGNLVLPITIRQIADGALGAAALSNVGLLCMVLVVILISYSLVQILRASQVVLLQRAIEERSTTRLADHLLRLPLHFFARRHPGDLAQRLRSGARLRQIASTIALSACFDVVLMIGVVAFLLVSYPSIATALILIALGLGLMMALTWRSQTLLATDALTAQVKASSSIHELLEAMPSVKALGAERVARTRWARAFAEDLHAGSRMRKRGGLLNAIILSAQFGAPLIVLVMTVVQVGTGGFSVGVGLGAASLAATLFASVSNIAAALTQAAALRPDLARVGDILENAVEQDGLKIDLTQAHDELILLENVSYEYPGSRATALSSISMHVRKGEHLGIIGQSGAGKSTLALLLSGMDMGFSGSIRIGGVPLRDADPRALREQIGYVDQNSRLFAGSIAENLRLGAPDATLDEIRLAAHLACIDDFIQTLPMRYETILGSGGGGLSGGQRQRIALARALVRQPAVLLLDEATSAIDPTTERQILRNLKDADKTLLVIAHRIGLVSDADRVVMVDAGRIVEVAPPPQIDVETPADGNATL